MSEGLKIIIGRFRKFGSFEFSGLVGVGDMQAAATVVGFLSDLGFRSARMLEIVYQDQLQGEYYGANLICVSGPDNNRVSERILNRVEHNIVFDDGGASLKDTKTDMKYSPEFDTDDEEQKTITVDYGLLIKAPNPFNQKCSVVVIAGCYGYGTWAGAKLAESAPFLKAEQVRHARAVECIYKVEIIEDTPQIPSIVLVRSI